MKINKKITSLSFLVTLTFMLTITQFSTLTFGLNNASITIQSNGLILDSAYDYLLSVSSNHYLAKNYTNGNLIYSTNDAASLFQYIFNILKPGQAVFVTQGTYILSAGLKCSVSNITFAGQGLNTKLIIDDHVNDDLLYVHDASWWVIHDFYIDGNSKMQECIDVNNQNGIHFRESSHVIIQNIDLYSAFSYGIKLTNTPYSIVRNCNVIGAQANGITFDTGADYGVAVHNNVSGSSDVGIDVGNSFNCSIIENNISNIIYSESPYGVNSQWGIATEFGSSNTTIRGNRVWHVGAGIVLGSEINDMVCNNIISDWDIYGEYRPAIELLANDSIVANNTMHELTTGQGGGVYVDGSNNLIIANKVNAGPWGDAICVGLNMFGEEITSSDNNIIKENDIQSSYYIVAFHIIAANNKFFNNTVCDSSIARGVFDEGSGNQVS